MATLDYRLNCELTKPVLIKNIDGMFFSQDNQANRIVVTVVRDGAPEVLSGSVSANIIRADGATVVQTGEIDGNVVTVTMPASAYAVPGSIAVVVKHTASGVTSTVAALTGYVYKSTTDTIVDPGTVVPNVNELLALIDDCEDATAACIAATAAAPVIDDTAGAGDTNKVWSASKVSGIDSEVNTLIPIDLAKGTTYTTGKYVKYSDGTLSNSSTQKASDYIDVSGIAKIIYTRLFTTSSSSYSGIAFYDAEKSFIADSGQRIGLNAAAMHYELTELSVPNTAKYIRLSAYSSLGDASVYDEQDYKSKVYPQIEAVKKQLSDDEGEIARLDGFTKEFTKDGYYKLPLAKWELGGWQSYSSSDSRQYRVRYTEPLIFDRDVYILAEYGFSVGGYYSSGNAIAGGSIVKIQKNTYVKIYSRRFSENTSEVISDITPFANAIKIATALSPIELYRPTFTDVSMFERMGVSGDSYAAGGGIISGITALTWGKNLQRQAGIQVDIYAKSGDSISDWNVNQTKGLPALLAGPECGLYWFQHGINGTSSAAAIGTPEDMEADPKPNTFYGQYVYAIQAVQNAFPKARIVIATILGSSYGMGQSSQMIAANTAIRNIAEYCEVPLIEITDDDYFRSPAYGDLTLSSHPTAIVSAGMAMAHRRLIAKCILENSSYFIRYGADE